MKPRDDDLIARYAKEGDMAAFEELYARHAARLLGFLISLAPCRDAAEDLAQKTWLRAIEALESYELRGRFQSWLFTLARHKNSGQWIEDSG